MSGMKTQLLNEGKIMERLPININIDAYPPSVRELLSGANIFDSHCRSGAQVLFVDRDDGYFLKSMEQGKLVTEADMTRYFGQLGLGARVLSFETYEGRDYMLSTRVPGEDCTHAEYLAEPERLVELYAEILRSLHDMSYDGCPVENRLLTYRATALENYRTGNYDKDSFPDSFGYASAEEALAVIRDSGDALRADTLLHGDYCLPNVMLDGWRFSGLVDVGNGGVGDRHIDLFWALWTLWYNLKADKYADRFLDAYGRERVDKDLLRTVAAFEVFG